MTRSMTAFSRQETSSEYGELIMEMRTVNHRYLDIFLRLPEDIRSLEPLIRERIGARLSRGKLECAIKLQPAEQTREALSLNEALIRQIAEASRHIDGILYDPSPISSLDVLRWPGVIQSRSPDPEALKKDILALLDTTLDDLVATREREGARLADMITERCDEMDRIVGAVQAKMPEIMQAWRDKLRQRLEEAGIDHDDERLEQELVMLAQKTDVAEEMDRLKMHIDEVRRVLAEDKPVGRRLDFLMQELNREANTLGSKSVHADTTRASVDMKVLIEQMREQIQNIE